MTDPTAKGYTASWEHRNEAAKLPALPPRPQTLSIDVLNEYGCAGNRAYTQKDADAYMDAQDARIKELESDQILRGALMRTIAELEALNAERKNGK
jgi:hypothetical protein